MTTATQLCKSTILQFFKKSLTQWFSKHYLRILKKKKERPQHSLEKSRSGHQSTAEQRPIMRGICIGQKCPALVFPLCSPSPGAAGGAGPKDAGAGGWPLIPSPGWAVSRRESWAAHSHRRHGGSGGKPAFWDLVLLVHPWEKCGLDEFSTHWWVLGMQNSSRDPLGSPFFFSFLLRHISMLQVLHRLQIKTPLSLSPHNSEKTGVPFKTFLCVLSSYRKLEETMC